MTFVWKVYSKAPYIANPSTAPVLAQFATPVASFTPPSTGEFIAELTVTDSDLGTATKTVSLRRNQLPIPVATVSPTPQTVPATGVCPVEAASVCVLNPSADISVDGSGSSDPDGSVVSYTWKLFDLATLSDNPNAAPVQTLVSPTPVATLTRPPGGLYVIELTVADDTGSSGAVASVRGTINVNRAPEVAFTPSTSDVPVLQIPRGSLYLVSANASDPEGESLTRFDWTFESGGTVVATDSTATAESDQIFNQLLGAGTVTLTVTDPEGASTTVTRPFEVVNQLPVPDLVSSPLVSTGTVGTAITFSSNTTSPAGDPDGTIAESSLSVCKLPVGGSPCQTYDLSAFGSQQQVVFGESGTYRIRLTVTDNDGGTAVQSIEVVIS